MIPKWRKITILGVVLVLFQNGTARVYSQDLVRKAVDKLKNQYSLDVLELEKTYADAIVEMQKKLTIEVEMKKAFLLDDLDKILEKAMDARDLDSANLTRSASVEIESLPYSPPSHAFDHLPVRRLKRQDLVGQVGKFFWQPLEVEFRRDGMLYRTDGYTRNPNETYWRVGQDGSLEILDADGKTVTSRYVGVQMENGVYAIGQLTHAPLPLLWWFDLHNDDRTKR